jgi:hypothetical protein
MSWAILVGVSAALACVSLGGGLYEFSVVDPSWPRRPDLIQPQHGGISRKRFWIPAHGLFELSLVASIVLTWSTPNVRWWLFAALACHAVMRIWSALDFIPKALAFERGESGTMSVDAARRWTRRSMLRFPLDVGTCVAMLIAFVQSAQSG